ncbi:MAG TPA: S8 family serine peptidase [Candidatus Thalassarchaeaceae archaeon]|nr:S8 family serine peptidase [Candidatus Thalassarchaeaceae archaeon]
MVLVLLLFSPIGTSFADVGEEGALPDEIVEVMPNYSRAVQLAFESVANLKNYDSEVLVTTSSWLVVTGIPIEAHHMMTASPDDSEDSGLFGAFIWTFRDPSTAIERLTESFDKGQIETFSPIIERTHSPRYEPNDPDFDEQWHLNNSGQSGGVLGEDANVTGAWENYNGLGVVISVIDDGLDHFHSDLQPHYSPSLSYDWCNDDPDPAPSSWNGHGTAVAGVAAAVGNNSIDVAGAAFGATIAGSTLIACGTSDRLEADALSFHQDDIDIYTNSWGPFDDGTRLEGPGPLTVAAIEDSVFNGRSGLGNIYTWAAGNGLTSNDNSNYDGYANSRYTIAVTAITHNGEQSWYAEPGANILVAAHSDGDGEGITTTDISGSGGYDEGDVTDDFGGTSSATPLAAGVIALILEANENLTWRDVQNVLVHSSRIVDSSDNSWEPNGAGLLVSHKYGFGSVDAGAAVSLAENWTSSGSEVNASFGPFLPNMGIDNGGTTWTEFNLSVPLDIQLESVDVIVDISHSYRGDLEIILESPMGHQSKLAEQHDDSSDDYSNWMFNTVQHWDESSLGVWKLKVRDTDTGNGAGTLNSWEVIFHGVGNVSDYDSDGWPDYNDPDDDNDGWDDESEEDCGTEQYNSSSFPPDNDLDGICDSVDLDDDNDGFVDSMEIPCETDPLDASSYPTDTDSDGTCNFLDPDDDNDGLTDFNETNVHGTDPLDYDTDDDGLNDYEEIVTYGTKADQSDTDQDGLGDYEEVFLYGTSPISYDSDADGLSDSDEITVWFSDPLVFDPDGDSDSFYHFQDCDDDDPEVNPEMVELLNGKDDDCDGFEDEGYNSSDSDGDGILDWEEFHIHGTNSTNADTDGDGLNDSTEINELGTDPLDFDIDEDGDGFYWFEDCDDENPNLSPGLVELLDSLDNDCDDEVDEDFISMDSDMDGISDFDEFHVHFTDPLDGDSDDDGLPDGTEVNEFDSDPLASDPDVDKDGWYAFQDCDDNDFDRAPDKAEELDGKDNDCDDEVDEDFYHLDSDGDRLFDFEEYHNYGTNPESVDSDQDGLEDGTEILEKMSNPLFFDYDRDEDGFYEFEECNDLVGSAYPGATELWNGMDDDCDGIVDESIDRISIIGASPSQSGATWDSANESLFMSLSGISQSLEAEITWMFGEYSVTINASPDGRKMSLPPIDCREAESDLEIQLCGEGTAIQVVKVEITDSGVKTEISWSLNVEIWIEPEPASGFAAALINSAGVIGIVAFVIGLAGLAVFAGARVAHNRKLQDALEAYGVTPERLAVRPENRGLVLPGAPEIHRIPSTDWNEDKG